MQSSSYSVQDIDSSQEFLRLRDEWNQCLVQAKQDSMFWRHEWFEYCWQRASDGERPRILIVRGESGRIVAIAPLMMRRDSIRGLPVRQVTFLENPDTPVSDIVAAENREVACGLMLEALVRSTIKWDVMILGKIPQNSETIAALRQGASRLDMGYMCDQMGKRMYLRNQGSWEGFLKDRSQRFRKTIRNVMNRVEKLGVVTVERHRTTPDLSQALQDICSVSERSWKGARGLSLGSSDGVKQFFLGLSEWARTEGWLDIWVLKIDGVPVAMEYDLVDKHKIWALRADFDESYKSVSPGSYLNALILKDFMQSDMVEYDMGPGSNDYKLRWTEIFHPVATCRLYNRNVTGRMLYSLDCQVIPFLRQLRSMVITDKSEEQG